MNRGPGVCEYGTGLFKESVRPKYKLEFCRIKNDLLCRVCVMYGTGTYLEKPIILNDMKKEILHLVALVAVIVAICVVGRFDYNDEILYNMSEGTYQVLREKLGDVSSSELVDVYMSDCEYWDSLGRLK